MKALILVAGYATRLYPLTKNRAKALLPLNDKPIINYIVDQLNNIEPINEIIVISNNVFYEDFFNWSKSVKSKINITVLNDNTSTISTRLGSIGDINFAIESCHIDEEIIVIAGDNYFTYELSDYYNHYLQKNNDFVCVKEIDDKEQLKQFAVAIIDKENKIVELEEKPKEPKSNIAVFATYIYKKDTLPLFKTYLEGGNNEDAPGYFVQWLYKIKDVYAYVMNGDCYDIGTPKSYNDLDNMLKNKLL